MVKTKQEEIREGTAKWLYESFGGKRWEKMSQDEKDLWLIHANGLLRCQGSLGAVIKVADVKELTISGEESHVVVFENMAVIEPLIGEKDG